MRVQDAVVRSNRLADLLKAQRKAKDEAEEIAARYKALDEEVRVAFGVEILPQLLRGEEWVVPEGTFSTYYHDNPYRCGVRVRISPMATFNYRQKGSRGAVTLLDTVQLVFVRRENIRYSSGPLMNERYFEAIDVTKLTRGWRSSGKGISAFVLAHKTLIRDPKSSVWTIRKNV